MGGYGSWVQEAYGVLRREPARVGDGVVWVVDAELGVRYGVGGGISREVITVFGLSGRGTSGTGVSVAL